MSTPEGPGRAPATPGLTSLPRIEELERSAGGGYDEDAVRNALEAYRRHVTQLQAQLRVLQAAGRSGAIEPTGHAVRMDALHLIRAASEYADTVERDAQQASANQLARTEEEVRRRQRDLQAQESELDRHRQDSERQRAEILNGARSEARTLLQSAHRDAAQEVREAEARAARLLEQARHQATELTNATRAEVEQTLEWARAQGASIIARAQQGAEQLLASAGLGEEQMARVAEAIVRGAEPASPTGRAPGTMPRVAAVPQAPATATESAPDAEPDQPDDPHLASSPSPPEPTADDEQREEPQA